MCFLTQSVFWISRIKREIPKMMPDYCKNVAWQTTVNQPYSQVLSGNISGIVSEIPKIVPDNKLLIIFTHENCEATFLGYFLRSHNDAWRLALQDICWVDWQLTVRHIFWDPRNDASQLSGNLFWDHWASFLGFHV